MICFTKYSGVGVLFRDGPVIVLSNAVTLAYLGVQQASEMLHAKHCDKPRTFTLSNFEAESFPRSNLFNILE